MERSALEGLEHSECPVFSAVRKNGFVMRVGGRSRRIRFRTGATGVTGDVAGRDGAVRCSQVGHAVPTALTPPART
jgi:hypothetical protein